METIYVLNPYTKRRIKVNGPTYNKLKKLGKIIDSKFVEFDGKTLDETIKKMARVNPRYKTVHRKVSDEINETSKKMESMSKRLIEQSEKSDKLEKIIEEIQRAKADKLEKENLEISQRNEKIRKMNIIDDKLEEPESISELEEFNPSELEDSDTETLTDFEVEDRKNPSDEDRKNPSDDDLEEPKSISELEEFDTSELEDSD